MKPTLLLDSNIIIDHLRNIPPATEFLMNHERRCAISVVTRAEVLAGPGGERAKPLLDAFTCYPIDTAIADLTARLRKRTRLKLPDAFQAALALHHELSLVTRNTKDFPPGKYPFVHVPYTLG